MNAQRKKHFAVEKLSAQGRELVDALLAANETYEDIVKQLRSRTGESLAVSSLARYRERKWFPTRAALEETDRLYGLVKEALNGAAGKNLDEVTSEAAKAMLFKVVAALKDPDPYALYSLVLAEGRLGVQKERNKILRERTGNDQQKIALLERAVKLRERQLERTIGAADAAENKVEAIARKKGLDAETLKKIREEVYGIVEANS